MQECRELYESVYLRFKRNGAAPGGGSVAECGAAGRADLATAKFLRERGQLVNQEFKDHSGHIPGIPVGESYLASLLVPMKTAWHPCWCL